MSKRALLASVLLAAPVLAVANLPMQSEPVLKESDHQKIGKLITAYIEARLDNGRGQVEAENELLEDLQKWGKKKQLGDKAPMSFTADLSASIWQSFEYSKAKGVKKGKIENYEVDPFRTGNSKLEFALWVPSKYNPRQAYPLILVIPDVGETPERHISEHWNSSEIKEGAMVACFPMPEDTSLWSQIGTADAPGGTAIALSAMSTITTQHATDFDRVYLAGRGAGVAAAIQLAALYPDRFAGVIGRAGDIGETGAENFHNVATYFSGGGARATAFAEACKSSGTDNCTLQPEGKEADIWAWMTEHPRNPYPSEVHILAGSPFPNKAYWVELPQSDGSVVNRINAKADRETNTITVEAEGARFCFLYFNDEIVDLDQPVKVTINGVEHVDSLPRNVRTMTDWIYRSGSDPGKVFVASKRYDILAREKSE